jgi:hypothetical protein
VVSLLATGVVIAPWLLWQRLEDPPGNALVKFALAGTYGFEEETKGLVATVLDAYGGLSLQDWIQLRVEAVATFLGAFEPSNVRWLWSQPMDDLGRLRLSDFAFLFPSLRLGNLGWLVVAGALLGRRRHVRSAAEAHAVRWALLGLAGVTLNALVLWTSHVTWTTSYLSLLFLAVGLYAALLSRGAWVRRIVLGGQIAYFLVVWWWAPLAIRPWREDQVAGWLLCVAGLWLIVASAVPDPPAEDPCVDSMGLRGWSDRRSGELGRP